MSEDRLDGWRKTLIALDAWVRRRFGRVRGTARVMSWLYPDDLRLAKPFQARIRYRGRLRLAIDTGSWIEWKVYFNGSYEPHLIRLLEALVRPGDVVIDAGANVGVHTLVLSDLVGDGGRVLAIEPHPVIVERLRENLEMNRIENTDILPVALASSTGMARLFEGELFAHNPGTASLWQEGQSETGIEVRLERLDQIAEQLDRLRLIKLDIQGAEQQAIIGGEEILKRHRPDLLFEYDRACWEAARADFNEMVAFLKRLGYTLFEVTRRGSLTAFQIEDMHGEMVELLAVTDINRLPDRLKK